MRALSQAVQVMDGASLGNRDATNEALVVSPHTAFAVRALWCA
jgi:hypothetical protein